jgi:hypothetical protein
MRRIRTFLPHTILDSKKMLSNFLIEFNIEYFETTSYCYMNKIFIGTIKEESQCYVFDPHIIDGESIINLRLDLPDEYRNFVMREIRDKVKYLNPKCISITKSKLYRFIRNNKNTPSHIFHPTTKLQNGCGIAVTVFNETIDCVEIRLNKFLTIKFERCLI